MTDDEAAVYLTDDEQVFLGRAETREMAVELARTRQSLERVAFERAIAWPTKPEEVGVVPFSIHPGYHCPTLEEVRSVPCIVCRSAVSEDCDSLDTATERVQGVRMHWRRCIDAVRHRDRVEAMILISGVRNRLQGGDNKSHFIDRALRMSTTAP